MGMKSLLINYNFIPWYAIGILLSTSYVTTDPFQPVSTSCVYWDFLELYSNGDPEKVHCIADEKGQLGIVNVRWKWVEQGSCPYFDRFGKQIHVKPCDSTLGLCPVKDYVSYQAVKYSACIESRIRHLTSLNNKKSDVQETEGSTTQSTRAENGHCNILPLINIAVSVVLLVTLVGLNIRQILNRGTMRKKEDMNPEEVKWTTTTEQKSNDSTN